MVARYAEEFGDSDDEETGYFEAEVVGHSDSGQGGDCGCLFSARILYYNCGIL